jgi:hypothetical protein
LGCSISSGLGVPPISPDPEHNAIPLEHKTLGVVAVEVSLVRSSERIIISSGTGLFEWGYAAFKFASKRSKFGLYEPQSSFYTPEFGLDNL